MLRVSVDYTKAYGSIDNIPPQIVDAVAAKIRQLTTNLQHHVVADKLQGQVLHHRTGALGRSIQTQVETTGKSTTGYVYSSGDVKYAAIHEFGFQGIEHVQQHLRSMVFGKEVAPFSVGPFDRQMNMPERSFLRSSLGDMATEIVKQIKMAALSGGQSAMGGKK